MTGDYPPQRLTIARILNPESVAVIGASEDLRKFGGRLIHNVISGGFEGRLIPVNPKRATIFGREAVPSVQAIDAPVDLAVCVVPVEHALSTIEACADKDVGACVVITAGFGEIDEQGEQLQRAMVHTARSAGMRLIGPNCLGLINTHANLILNSSPAMQVTPNRPGGIGHLTQSGALMATVYNRGVGDGAKFSVAVSLGNQADLELADFMEYLAEDPHTQVVTLYVEGFRHPQRFIEACRRCVRAGKPVMMLKSGTSEYGARVTRSHTASLATRPGVLAAVCESEGIILVDDIRTLIQTAELFVGHGPATGNGICVMSGSGGAAAMTADRMSAMGLRLAEFSAATREQLEVIYEPTQLGNPLDVGALREKSFTNVDDGGLGIAARDEDVSAVLLPVTTAPMVGKVTHCVCNTMDLIDKPLLSVVMQGSADDGAREILRARGRPCYETTDEALRVLQAWIKTAMHPAPSPERPGALRCDYDPRCLGVRQLSEAQVKGWVRRYGLTVVDGDEVSTLEQALACAQRLGYPVALKAVGGELIHKSDIGGVELNLENDAALTCAWQRMMAIEHPSISGFYVCRMASGQVEVLLGINNDPEFGPMVGFGIGGVNTEILGDFAMLRAPVTSEAVLERLKGLKLSPLLFGYRGSPPTDIDQLCDMIVRLSWLAIDAGDYLETLDLNPVLVGRVGEGAIVVDARATLSLQTV